MALWILMPVEVIFAAVLLAVLVLLIASMVLSKRPMHGWNSYLT